LALSTPCIQSWVEGGTSKELWLRSSFIFLHLYQAWNFAIHLLNPHDFNIGN
jgi:hypothetical protein